MADSHFEPELNEQQLIRSYGRDNLRYILEQIGPLFGRMLLSKDSYETREVYNLETLVANGDPL